MMKNRNGGARPTPGWASLREPGEIRIDEARRSQTDCSGRPRGGEGPKARPCEQLMRGVRAGLGAHLSRDLTMIGKVLGHRKIQTTARHAHLARDSVKESAALVAASIGKDILS